MFCKKCGYMINDGMESCPVCGTPVLSPNEKAEANAKASGNTQNGYTSAFSKSGDDFWDDSNWTYKNKGDNKDISDNTTVGYSNYNTANTNTQENTNSTGNTFNGSYGNSGPGFNNTYGNYPPVNPSGGPTNGQGWAGAPNNIPVYNTPNAPKKKNNTVVIAVAIIAAILVLGIAGIIVFFSIVNSTVDSMMDYGNDIIDQYDDFDFDYDYDVNDDTILDSDMDLNYYKGTVSGNRYENEYFGFVYDIPDTYYTYTESDIEVFFGDNDNLEYGVIGLDLIDETFNEMVVMIFDAESYSAEMYMESVIRALPQYYEEGTYVVDSVSKNTRMMGMDFIFRTMEITDYNPEEDYKYTDFYVTKKDGMLLLIKCYYDYPEQRENMLSHFSVA